MFHFRFLKTIVVLLLVIAGVHHLALSNALYVLIPNLDTIIHAAAGFVVGLTAISFAEKMYDINTVNHQKVNHPDVKIFICVLLAAIIIGVAWEVFEKFIGFTSYLDIEDTVIDLIADVAGAMAAFGVYRFINW